MEGLVESKNAEWIGTGELARLAGRSGQWVRNLARAGEIPAVRLGNGAFVYFRGDALTAIAIFRKGKVRAWNRK